MCTSTPQYAFMAWCLVKAQGQLYVSPLQILISQMLHTLESPYKF